jgi:hypothetical protein
MKRGYFLSFFGFFVSFFRALLPLAMMSSSGFVTPSW